jgi:PAT family beta-lactamase induction signal transducer AmpG
MRRNLLDTRNGRFLTFGFLYVSEGVPYGFTSVAMVAFMRQHGVSLEVIGAFSAALFLPWAFKWVWAPLIDLIRLDRWGGRRAWILGCTTMMLVGLLVVANIDAQQHFLWLLATVIVLNFFCATQDVAIDSLAVSTLRPDERARGNGFMFGGQYLGIMLGGGAAVFVTDLVGFNGALLYVGSLCLMNVTFVLFFVHDPFARPLSPQPLIFRSALTHLVAFVQTVYTSFWRSGPGPIFGTGFALLPCGAMALAYATLATIQVDYGFNGAQIARLQILNTVAAASGCLLGGFIADRFGIKRTIASGFVGTALLSLLLASQISEVGLTQVSPVLFVAVVTTHGLFFGVSYGARSAIFMGMTNPAVAATQFTAFMAMSNLAISMGNYWQGMVAERMGYAQVLYLDALIALLVIAVTPFLRGREEGAAVTASAKVVRAVAAAGN